MFKSISSLCPHFPYLPILSRAPGVFDRMLRGLPDEMVRRNEGEGTWSAFDVVGHLVHGEKTDWMERIGIIMKHGENKPFKPFDRFAQLKDNVGKSMDDLLDSFAELRARNLKELAALDLRESDLDRRGAHPNLGPVTLRNLIATWAAHDYVHIAQICRLLGKFYAPEIGPWMEYMRLLKS